MSWAAIEDAMQAAVVSASGLASSKVYWSYQDRNEEVDDYVVITFGGDIPSGQDWVRRSTDLTRPNGQEILEQVQGIREVPFQIECFSTDVVGEATARRMAEKIRSSFMLSRVRSIVRKARVSPFDSDQVSWVPDILAARFRGRAVVTLRCYVPVVDVYDYIGYIARVRGRIYFSPVSPTGPFASGVAFDSLQASGASGYQRP